MAPASSSDKPTDQRMMPHVRQIASMGRTRLTRAALDRALDPLTRLQQRRMVDLIAPLSSWVEHMVPDQPLRITVVLATRNRAELLPGAISSVLAQVHCDYELVVVNDGSTDGTAAVLDELADPRMQVIHTQGIGLSGARNIGLDNSSGAVVTYLDDDNRLDPLWLKGVAWAFLTHPELSHLFGARIMPGGRVVPGMQRVTLPQYQFIPYRHWRLRYRNTVDAGVIAHRRDLAEARFDISLAECGDWDLIVRLSRTSPPLALPLVACYYAIDAPHRMTGTAEALRESEAMLRRWNA
jgi:hypothetical protein